jgi:hypothetical protein
MAMILGSIPPITTKKKKKKKERKEKKNVVVLPGIISYYFLPFMNNFANVLNSL